MSSKIFEQIQAILLRSGASKYKALCYDYEFVLRIAENKVIIYYANVLHNPYNPPNQFNTITLESEVFSCKEVTLFEVITFLMKNNYLELAEELVFNSHLF